MLQLSSAIIAGGKSQRFGRPKALAKLKTKSLVQYSIDLALELSEEVFLVHGENNYFEDYKEVIFVQDELPNLGPLIGIYSALKQSSKEYLAVIPCDMPNLNSQIYEKLAEHLPAKIVTAQSNNGLEPLVSIWHRSNIPLIERAIQEKSLALKDYIKQTENQIVKFSENSFHNINYERDLELN